MQATEYLYKNFEGKGQESAVGVCNINVDALLQFSICDRNLKCRVLHSRREGRLMPWKSSPFWRRKLPLQSPL